MKVIKRNYPLALVMAGGVVAFFGILVFASGPGELAIGFDHLANASRADRMAITHEAAAGVDRQREGRNPTSDL